MKIEESVPLATLTTLRVGGAARYVITCAAVEDVKDAIRFAREKDLPFYPLGEGSNVLASDNGYAGVILKIEIPGLRFEETDEGTLAIAGAGVSWDRFVSEAAARGLWGIENLAGIPGYVGAAPVQNVGAYGMEVKDTLAYVDVLDATTLDERRLTNAECAFAYRDSRFKHDPSLIITSIALLLRKDGAPKIEYGDLLRAREAGADLSTPEAIGKAVREIRAKKFPDRREFGTAGSFFKNPVLSDKTYEALHVKYGEVPRFPNPNGIKIPLAFILDKVLSLRGYRKGNAWLFGAQPLVLVLDPGSNARDVDALAQEIEARVHEATGISIEREVRSMPEK